METRSTHEVPDFAKLVQPEEQELPAGATDSDKDKHDRLLQLLNKTPHASWIKTHDTLKAKVNGKMVPHQYLPIDKIKWVLTRLFGLYWKDEIISVSTAFNSPIVTVRLHYCIPGTSIWLSKDGIGAVGVQTNAGAAAGSLSEIKGDGVMKAAPAAASYALSNAAEKLGKIFGASLNKADYLDFAGTAYDQVANGTPPAPPEPPPATYYPPPPIPVQQPAYQQPAPYGPPIQQAQPPVWNPQPAQQYPQQQAQFSNPNNMDL